MVNSLSVMRQTPIYSLGGEHPLEKRIATHSSILAWRIDGQSSLVGYSPWGHTHSDMTERLSLAYLKYSDKWGGGSEANK